jgi:hypothetical protein
MSDPTGSQTPKQIATDEFMDMLANAFIEYKRAMLDAVAKAKSTGVFNPLVFDNFIKEVEEMRIPGPEQPMDSLPPATSVNVVVIDDNDPSTSKKAVVNLMALELIKGLTIAIEALETLGELRVEKVNGVDLRSLDDVRDAAMAFQREISG